MEGAHVTNTPLVSRVRASQVPKHDINISIAAWPVSQLIYPSQTAMALKRVQQFYMSLRVCLLSDQAKMTTPISNESVTPSAAGLLTAYFHQIHSSLELNTRHSISLTVAFILSQTSLYVQGRSLKSSLIPQIRGIKLICQKIYTKRESNPPRVLDSVGS